MTNVQERLLLPSAVSGVTPPFLQAAPSGTPVQSDRVYPIRPPLDPLPSFNPDDTGTQLPAGLSGLLSQLMQMLQAFFSGDTSSSSPGSAGNFYENANASSTGDPHLEFNGTTRSGKHREHHFDSMRGHRDLLQSNSFTGGYRIATQTTAPGKNGVTYNQEASVFTNYGQTHVCLDNDGNARIEQNGESYALGDGQSYDLGNGETVTRSGDGTVVVTDANQQGGTITTTLHDNGPGVDVNAQANNVLLSGDLLTRDQ